MARYIDADKLSEMIQAKADTLIEGKEAFLYVAKWLELLHTADVVPKSEVAKLIEDFQRSIRADAKCGMSAGEILLHINNMLVELKKKYTEGKDEDKN